MNEIPLENVIQSLLDVDTPVNPRVLNRLSDLEPNELEQLRFIWEQLPLWRRKALMEDIEELGAHDFLLDFMALGQLALEDRDPGVRLLAVHTLWEYEQTELIHTFLNLIQQDQDCDVRAAAATGLSRFIYAGEIEEIPAARLAAIEDTLLKLTEEAEADQVRRAALESLGFSSREEVTPLIEKAFASKDKNWKASALLAMGRSANPDWKTHVMAMLESPIPILRAEAARAAGELELEEAVSFLLELLDDPDEYARSASIWSLSQIGGEDVREALEGLYEEADNDDDLEFIESALENLTFTEGVKFIPFFDFPDEPRSEADEDQ
ncbi:MAG: HEAT repeat domain-containing protein [Anaerolineae bacterium]|nr:HEAT repeat domain-containing protein [Anaerolineae bacterium]